MLFENNSIETSDLPRFEEQSFQPLKKAYLKLIVIQWTVFILFPAAGLIYLSFFNDTLTDSLLIYFWIGLASFYLIRLLIIFAGFKRKGFLLREHDILYRSGIIVFKVTAVPYNRIQHSEIRQGFLSRLFRISKLKIFTAGGAASDLAINGLVPDEAQRMKDFLSKTVSSYE
jgi:uncharacterized protein